MKEREKDQAYFNFPIQLLSGFMVNDQNVLLNIFYYSIYKHSLTLDHGDELENIAEAASFFNIEKYNANHILTEGTILFDSLPENSPRVGLKVNIFWDYFSNNKSDFDKACLLGHLALKSILQRKSYYKIDNKFWLARMDGKAKSSEFNNLSEPLLKYANEYQTKKIKNELRDNWGLVTYSRYTRGFYVSYSMSLNDLVFEAEKRRKSTKEKQKKAEEKEAVNRALNLLYGKNV